MTKKLNSKLLFAITLFIAFCISFTSCSFYDEQDVTIIAYLKINDLLESKLSKTCQSEIAQLEKAFEDYNNAQLASNFWGVNFNTDFNYDTDAIKTFNKRYTATDGKSIKLKQLEADITAELWNYLNLNYSDVIPAKAQNVEEGRFYTIAELKTKYPNYKELEIEDFSPMELVDDVMSEKLFSWSMTSRGDINLRTMYVYYLANKVSEKDSNID